MVTHGSLLGLFLACGGWDGLREAESSLGILNGIALSLGDVGTLLEGEQSRRVSLEPPVIATLWRTHSVSVHLDAIGLRSLTPPSVSPCDFPWSEGKGLPLAAPTVRQAPLLGNLQTLCRCQQPAGADAGPGAQHWQTDWTRAWQERHRPPEARASRAG